MVHTICSLSAQKGRSTDNASMTEETHYTACGCLSASADRRCQRITRMRGTDETQTQAVLPSDARISIIPVLTVIQSTAKPIYRDLYERILIDRKSFLRAAFYVQREARLW